MLRPRVRMKGHAKDQGRDGRTYLRPRQSVSVPLVRALLLEASQQLLIWSLLCCRWCGLKAIFLNKEWKPQVEVVRKNMNKLDGFEANHRSSMGGGGVVARMSQSLIHSSGATGHLRLLARNLLSSVMWPLEGCHAPVGGPYTYVHTSCTNWTPG